jgi:hypothetical protein
MSVTAAQKPEPTDSPPAQPGQDITVDDKHEAQKRTEELGAKAPAREEMEPGSEPPKKEDDDDPDSKKFALGAYVESFYQWNFNRPGNGISNFRGYDTRHNTLTLSNAVLDAGFRTTDLLGRIAVQFGQVPATAYQEEPTWPGADGAGESDARLWRHLQRASVGWQATRSLLFEAGLFLTNTGVESLAVKDNWNWSRTTAFVRLPTYQTGVKMTLHASPRLDVTAGLFNGWNSVVDNNDEKSILLQAQGKLKESLSASIAYLGGVERDRGALEGRPWRHAFDAYLQVDATRRLQLAAEVNGGFERTAFGTHWFAGMAAYARAQLLDWLYLAARGDRLSEQPASNASGSSQPFLLPVEGVTSATFTFDVRPIKGLSLRLEYRHDRARGDLFFRGVVQGDGSAEMPYVPNTRFQNTLLVGTVIWF